MNLTESSFAPTEKKNSCGVAIDFYGFKTTEPTNKILERNQKEFC